jgi:hypothetical protein
MQVGAGQRAGGRHLHHDRLPPPRVRAVLLREERVVLCPFQKLHGELYTHG